MKERVLITGASGFLGFHLIKAALNNDLEVYAGIRKTSDIDHLIQLPVHLVELNFSDQFALAKDLMDKKYNYIIHAAGTTKANSLEQYNLVNADYSYNMAKAVQDTGIPIKKFVFISSLAAIGPIEDMNSVITEATFPHPVTNYGRSKLLSENKLAELSIPLVILRPTAIYGPRERDIFLLFKSIKRGIEPYIGRSEQLLSFIYAEDMANVTISALTVSDTGIYNISDGLSYNRYDFAGYLKQIMHRKTLKFHLPVREVKILASTLERIERLFKRMPVLNQDKLNELTGPNWVCDIDKARKELNFNPAFNLEKGLAKTLEWYRQFNWI